MQRWPAVDRDLRRRLLDEVRRRHNVEAGQRSPAERLMRLDELRALVRAIARPDAAAGRAAGSDEPLELLQHMKARFRQAGERP